MRRFDALSDNCTQISPEAADFLFCLPELTKLYPNKVVSANGIKLTFSIICVAAFWREEACVPGLTIRYARCLGMRLPSVIDLLEFSATPLKSRCSPDKDYNICQKPFVDSEAL